MASDKMRSVGEHEIDWDDWKVARLWDYYSRTPPYSNLYVAKRFGHHILRRSGLPLRKPIRVLDFGCGPGFIWDHLLALGSQWRYTGADFSQSSVEALARRTAGHANCDGVHHVKALPTNLPAEGYDAVLLLEVVEHLKEEYLDGTLAEMRRVLKRGGTLVISTPNEEDLSEVKRYCPECGAIFHQWQHVRSWSISSLKISLEQHGFALEKYSTLNFEQLGAKQKMFKVLKLILGSGIRNPNLIANFIKV